MFKRLYFYLFFIVFAFMLVACDFFPDEPVTVTGTVIIKRNGEPWNPEHIDFVESGNVLNGINTDEMKAVARDSRPPPNYKRIYIDKSLVENEDDLAQGKYTWKIEIPSNYLPGPVSFEIWVPMANLYVRKEIKEYYVEDENSEIDLGEIDFDVIRLWGTLPVTFNGEPLSYSGTYSTNSRCILYIKGANETGKGAGPDIGFKENWVQDIYARETETPLVFTVETCHRGGFFKKVLNPNHEIAVFDTDKEIIFPDYPNGVDFEAFVLKGTIDLVVPNGQYLHNSFLNCTIDFYDTEKKSDKLISRLDNWTYWENENVTPNWETWVSPFTFPKTLVLELLYRNYAGTRVNTSITITEETDLQNIYLGSFPANP